MNLNICLVVARILRPTASLHFSFYRYSTLIRLEVFFVDRQPPSAQRFDRTRNLDRRRKNADDCK